MYDHIKEKTAVKDQLAKIERELEAVQKKGDLSKINLDSFEKSLNQLREEAANLQKIISSDLKKQTMEHRDAEIAIHINTGITGGEPEVGRQREVKEAWSKQIEVTTAALEMVGLQLGKIFECQDKLDTLKATNTQYQGARLNHVNSILEHEDMKKISVSAEKLTTYGAKQLKSSASIDRSKGQIAQSLSTRMELVMSVVNDKKISSDKKVELLVGLKNEVDAAIKENQRAVKEYDTKRLGVTLTGLLSATLRSENLDKELKSLSCVLTEVTKPYEKLVALKQTPIVAERLTISVTPTPPAQQETPSPSKKQ